MEELNIIQVIYDLAKENASSIKTINHELGGIETSVNFIKWFIGINVIAWIGLMVGIVGRKLFKNNKG